MARSTSTGMKPTYFALLPFAYRADRCGDHHQHMRLQAVVSQFVAQRQALGHAKSVLLVDDGQGEVLEQHFFLYDGVGTDHQRCLAAFDQMFRRGGLLLRGGF